MQLTTKNWLLVLASALISAGSGAAQTSAFPTSAVPAIASAEDTTSVELGVKFRTTQNGTITGIRFYKGSSNRGTHVATLWSASGAPLAKATFSNETATGWQEVRFASPVAVIANTTYVASYFAPLGGYSKNERFFATAVTNGPIRLLSDSESRGNGVYRYGASGFPTQTYNQSNYWVDVVFQTATAPPPPPPVLTSSSIWSTSATPAQTASADTQGVEVGMKFRTTVNGVISGVRFYKGSGNAGTHVGNLWSKSGTMLGRVTFTNETNSGWQEARFATPVAVSANTTYIVSYFAPQGRYAKNEGFFASATTNGSLRALADGEDGPNGVYRYAAATTFPNSTFASSNYWVDVVFSASSAPSTTQPVQVSVNPVSSTLTAAKTQQFSATVTGSTNTSVAWTLSPAVGSISSTGLYSAPATVSSTQTVRITATSAADVTKQATAVVTVNVPPDTTLPSVSVTTPTSGATVSGTVNISAAAADNVGVVGVQFGVDGKVLGTELKSAPFTTAWNTNGLTNGSHTISVTARDAAGNVRTAIANVLVSNASTPPDKIVLPVAVFGPAGTTKSVDLTLATASLTGTKLWLQIHGLNYPNKVGVQINNGPWVSLNESTVSLDPLAVAYGGIGGGFHTLKLTMDVPAGTFVSGKNTIRFRFNTAIGGALGFRVLKMNVLNASGAQLLPADAFVQDSPRDWTIPRNTPADIAEGKRLFQEAVLLDTPSNPVPIRARCNDCHTHDGRDLKYFNFESEAIRASAVSHGMSATQGDQIASYIRSLDMPAPGRPWNPVYQPGPGLDSKPVSDWAAGAGIDAVLDEDQKTLDFIYQPDFAVTANLNAREVPLAIQLPDWAHWLPKVHPKDAWGDAFLTSDFNKQYASIRSKLRFRDPVAFRSATDDLSYWEVRRSEFLRKPETWTEWHRKTFYGASQWKMVKLWEMMHEFELQDFGREMFGPQAEQRSWWEHDAFLTSPNMIQIDAGPGLGNGSEASHLYLAYVWYQLQLVLNNSNKRMGDNSPLDWPYVYGFIKAMGYRSPQAGVTTLFLIKAMQVSENGRGPEIHPTDSGWQWLVNDVSRLVHGDYISTWDATPLSRRIFIHETLLQNWLNKVKTFTPQQFYANTAEAAKPDEVVRALSDGKFGERMWYAIPRFKHFGVNQTLVNGLADWAKTVWPNNNWNTLKTATCTGDNHVRCTTD